MSSPLPPGAERRVDMRRSLRGDARITLPSAQQFTVRTLDISVGGMAIVANANPRPGTAFIIEFPLPTRLSSVPIETRVQVMHSILAGDERGFKIGLKFVDPDDETLNAIRQFLR